MKRSCFSILMGWQGPGRALQNLRPAWDRALWAAERGGLVAKASSTHLPQISIKGNEMIPVSSLEAVRGGLNEVIHSKVLRSVLVT